MSLHQIHQIWLQMAEWTEKHLAVLISKILLSQLQHRPIYGLRGSTGVGLPNAPFHSTILNLINGIIPLISSNELSCTKCQIWNWNFSAIKRLSFSAFAFLKRKKSWFYISQKKKIMSRLRFWDSEPQRFAW